MAKSKSSSKRNDAKKKDDGSAEIRRAEKRLEKALAGVDGAREKAARRERELAALMEQHGRTPVLDVVANEAIPLEAPSQAASANGAIHGDHEAPESVPANEQPEQLG